MANIKYEVTRWDVSCCHHTHPTQSGHADGVSSKKRYKAGEVDFFVCCALDSHRFWVLPFKAAIVTTLKIYNGKVSKFHRYEDAWILLEK